MVTGMREIGSEFWEVPTNNTGNGVFPSSTQWFLSGRSALQAIIKGIKERKEPRFVAMPSYCCDSMIVPFLKEGIEVRFYPVYPGEDGLVQEIDKSCDILFLIDYFGYSAQVFALDDYGGEIIRDVTHSVFSYSYNDADYCFGSLRKWCGVWTGGYAWGKAGHGLPMTGTDDYGYAALREKAMKLKDSYIHGWGAVNKEHLRVFEEAEEALERVTIAPAKNRDIELAKKLNVEFINSRRRANAEVLRSAFSEWLIFPHLSDSDTPMFVPVLVPEGKRDELRRYLIKHEIYCPVHWPVSEYHRLDERTVYIYQNELSLVCDQRYTVEDMNRMVETIKMFVEG